MYSNASPFKRISTYVDAIKHEQVKKVLTRARVSYVQWLDLKQERLISGKDPDIVRWAVAGAGAILLLGAGWWGYNKYELSKLRCRDFKTHREAQAAYDRGAKHLDGDKDGIACENLR